MGQKYFQGLEISLHPDEIMPLSHQKMGDIFKDAQ
jgi:hypothetical protein